MPNQPYFPSRIGDRIIWLNNFRNKLPNYATVLGYTPAEVAAVQGDCDYAVYLLDTFQAATRRFSDSATAAVRDILNGSGNSLVALPSFALPPTPPPPAAVLPGAIRRVLGFVKNLKTRPGYTEAIGADLGVVGAEETQPNDNSVPEPQGEARSGEVVISFKKKGHMGVWIEGQTGNETTWSFLAIDTTNPYNDTRPLKVPNQPEQRRYRLCYWDGEPTNDWSNAVELTFGG